MSLSRYMYWITDNVCGGPIPHSREDYEYLRSIGISVIVSLVEEWEYEAYTSLSESEVRELVKNLGMLLVRCPTPDGFAPPEDKLLELVKLLDEYDREGRKVYVHCVGGMGRTPTVLACFLVYRGYTAEDALRRVNEVNPEMSITDEQYYAVKAFELLLRRTR